MFVLLSMTSPFAEDWTVRDLWQAHSSGGQLEIYGAREPAAVTGFSDGSGFPFLLVSTLFSSPVG